jgi:hypothetical protein
MKHLLMECTPCSHPGMPGGWALGTEGHLQVNSMTQKPLTPGTWRTCMLPAWIRMGPHSLGTCALNSVHSNKEMRVQSL